MKDKETTKKKEPVGFRYWLVFILIGLSGQFAWSIENMYLNTFITYLNFTAPEGQMFNYSFMIALTTALSAIVATLTTIFIGALIDKVRKRKIFITIGYLLWGISTALFGLLNTNNANDLIPISLTASTAASLVIVIDCIMTFFGSTSNDAAFNAYVTKNTKDSNRGKVEGVLSVLPLVSMLIIFVFLNNLTTKDFGYRWDLFFYIIGGIVFVIGLISIFLIPKEEKEVVNNTEKQKYFSLMIDGFKPSNIKKNKRLYLVFICYFVEAVAMQVFFPYLMVYIERTLNISNTGDSLMTPFSIVMALALIVGSLLSVVFGFLSDKLGKVKMILPSLLIQLASLLMMFFAVSIPDGISRVVYTSFSGILLILGYVLLPTLFNALIREDIPKGKEGSYMGVRMLFVVALPMLIGPFIGDALNQSFGQTYSTEYGELTFLPSNYGYLVAFFILLLLLIPLFFLSRYDRKHRKNKGYLVSELKKDKLEIDENEIPLSEYPYKQFERENYLSLNGIWEYVITDKEDIPYNLEKNKIRVPYAVESPQSLVNHLLQDNEIIYYFKSMILPIELYKDHIFLCFDGVDQIADVYINDQFVFNHVGGYTRFKIDIRPYIKDDRVLNIVVKVKDLTDKNNLMRGKQSYKPWAFLYSSSSGIYKPVSIVSTDEKYIEDIDYDIDYDNKKVRILLKTNSNEIEDALMVLNDNDYNLKTNIINEIDLSNNFHPWGLNDPYLYEAEFKYLNDRVKSYFAMKKITIKKGKNENGFYLNDKKIILNGLLDQGYYDEGGLTPKSYNEYEKDVINMKQLGFNCVRMHVKTEMDMFYYYCDKYGLLVIQDMPNGGDLQYFFFNAFPRLSIKLFNHSYYLNDKFYGRKGDENKEKFIKDSEEIIKQTKNHPSIYMYTLFNESWGEFNPKETYLHMKNKYPSLYFDTTSGWLDDPSSDVFSIHSYTLPHRRRKDKTNNRPYFLSEVGGYGLLVKDHFYYPKTFSHSPSKTSESLTKKYEKLYEGFIKQIKANELQGIIYTQLNDCEGEINGLYSLDRKILKIDENTIKKINNAINSLY